MYAGRLETRKVMSQLKHEGHMLAGFPLSWGRSILSIKAFH